jgi:hypothetical protein
MLRVSILNNKVAILNDNRPSIEKKITFLVELNVKPKFVLK